MPIKFWGTGSLLMGLCVMLWDADTGGGTGGDAAPPAGGDDGGAVTGGEGDLSKLPPEVQAYIKSLRDENAKHRIKASEIEKAAKTAEENRLAEQQQWKTLAEQRKVELDALTPKATVADALLERISTQNKARIEKLPEVLRTIVPADYDPVKLSEWLDANVDKLTRQAAPNLDGGDKGGNRGNAPVDYSKMGSKVNF